MSKRIKRLSVWLMVLVFSFAQCVTVFAQDCAVSYEGQAKQFIFLPGSKYSPTDLFSAFKNVMPGDKLTESIEVRNNSEDTIRVYMRALGVHEFDDAQKTKEGKEFLAQMQLSVSRHEADKLSDTSADLPGGLSEWVCLGTFQKGEKATLDVTLQVPLEMENTFQDAVGYVDWQFKVEEAPQPVTPKPQEKTEDKKPSETIKAYTPVKTGDHSQIWYYVVLVMLSGIVLWRIRHRQHAFGMVKWIQRKR